MFTNFSKNGFFELQKCFGSQITLFYTANIAVFLKDKNTTIQIQEIMLK